jgi:hypothetical protein
MNHAVPRHGAAYSSNKVGGKNPFGRIGNIPDPGFLPLAGGMVGSREQPREASR